MPGVALAHGAQPPSLPPPFGCVPALHALEWKSGSVHAVHCEHTEFVVSPQPVE